MHIIYLRISSYILYILHKYNIIYYIYNIIYIYIYYHNLSYIYACTVIISIEYNDVSCTVHLISHLHLGWGLQLHIVTSTVRIF